MRGNQFRQFKIDPPPQFYPLLITPPEESTANSIPNIVAQSRVLAINEAALLASRHQNAIDITH